MINASASGQAAFQNALEAAGVTDEYQTYEPDDKSQFDADWTNKTFGNVVENAIAADMIERRGAVAGNISVADTEGYSRYNVGDNTVFSTQGMDVENGMTVVATPHTMDGTVLSEEDFEAYVNGLLAQATSVAELLDLDNVENGGLGLIAAAAEGDTDEVVDAMQDLSDDLGAGALTPGNGKAPLQTTEYANAQPAVTPTTPGAPGGEGGETVEVQVTANTDAAQSAISGLSGMTVTVNVVANASGIGGAVAAAAGGSGGAAAAKGTSHSEAGTYLVDEDGAELIEHRDTGTYELGTNKGARFVRLNAGDIVHSASETRKIMRRNGAKKAGPAARQEKKPEAVYTPLAGGVIHGGVNRFGDVQFYGQSVAITDAGPGVPVDGGDYQTHYTYGTMTPWERAAAEAMRSADRERRDRLSAFQNDELTTRIANANEIVDWLKKLIDWIPTYLANLKKKTTELIGAADDAIHYLYKNKSIDGAIDNVAQEIKANIAAVLRYRSFLADFSIRGPLDDEMIKQIQNGSIDIRTYHDEATVKAIQAYQQYWEKLQACLDTIGALNDQMEELSRQKLDNVVDYFDRIDGLLRDQQKNFETLIDLKKQYGQELTTADYASSLDALTQMLENAQREETALLKELTEQLGVDGDLVQAVLAGGKDVWDTISEHAIKPEDTGYEELREQLSLVDELDLETAEEERERLIREQRRRRGMSAQAWLLIHDNAPTTSDDTTLGITSMSEAFASTIPVDTSKVKPDVTPATDADIIELGEKLGLEMTGGSEEALANFEAIKSLFTTSWDTPLAIGSETWYQYMSTLEELRERITSTRIEIGEMNDEIANIPLNNLKTGYEYLDDIRKNYEHINNLLDAQGSPKSQGTYRSLISVGMKQIENLQEQNKLIEEQMSQLDPLSEKYKELRDDLGSNLDTIASIRENQEQWNDAIIDLQIDRLRKQNDAYKEQLNLMHALNDLEDARQRRIMTYREGEGFVYEVDEDAMEAAQESATDAVYSSLIASLEHAKEDNNIYGPLGERLITGSSILDMFGNTLVPVEDRLSGLDFTPYYQSILNGAEQSSLLAGILGSIDMAKLLESAVSGDVNIDLSGMTLNGVNDAQELGDAIIQQLPNYLMQYLYQKGAN